MIIRSTPALAIAFSAIVLVACPETKSGDTNTAKQPAAPATPSSQPAQPATPASQPSGALHNHDEAEHDRAVADGKGSTPDTRDQVDPDGVMRRGAALTDAKAMTVTDAIASADKLAGQSVKITGTIDAVCANKGCWFVVRGDKPNEQVRVTAKNYGFFVAKSTLGAPATVEGQLEVKEIDQAFAQHMEDERASAANEPKKTITGPQRELSITAAAVEIKTKS